MKARTRSRNAASIGSNQSAKSETLSTASGCTVSGFVVGLVMAWSPAQRANAGLVRVRQPGDYATLNSNQPRDSTGADAPGLSAATVRRLTETWQAEHLGWQERDLSVRRYVYLWADG